MILYLYWLHDISVGNFLFSVVLSVLVGGLEFLVEGLAVMAEGMDAPTIPTPKPRDEFFIKFLREVLFSLLISNILI